MKEAGKKENGTPKAELGGLMVQQEESEDGSGKLGRGKALTLDAARAEIPDTVCPFAGIPQPTMPLTQVPFPLCTVARCSAVSLRHTLTGRCELGV